jgi:hypothetical protein
MVGEVSMFERRILEVETQPELRVKFDGAVQPDSFLAYRGRIFPVKRMEDEWVFLETFGDEEFEAYGGEEPQTFQVEKGQTFILLDGLRVPRALDEELMPILTPDIPAEVLIPVHFPSFEKCPVGRDDEGVFATIPILGNQRVRLAFGPNWYVQDLDALP